MSEIRKAAIRVGDVVETRKKHPCGSSQWEVTRTGADIKMKCLGCGRLVMLDRETFLKRRKKIITEGPLPEAPDMTYYAPAADPGESLNAYVTPDAP